MSQLKLSGDASGTGIVTVAAPNTNNTYTVTLPAAAGTFAQTDVAQTFTGTQTFNGNVVFGDATSDTITATARLASDLVPSTDNARDLGTSALAYRSVYAGTSFVEAGYKVVTQTDIGTAPNEIPLNQYLGSMAFQDGDTSDITVYGVRVGRGAGAVATNTAVGNTALYSNITGATNTAVGSRAGYFVTSSDNTLVGNDAGRTITTGSNNTALGSYVMNNSAGVTGQDNVGIGRAVLSALTGGSYNTAVGGQSLVSNTTASYNTAVGWQALNASNRTADTNGYNTAIGYGSGSAITTGQKNTIIGGYTGNQGGLDIRTSNNYIVMSDGDGKPRAGYHVGYGGFFINQESSAVYSQFNYLIDGVQKAAMWWDNSLSRLATYTNAAGPYVANGGTSWTSSSDERLKNITGEIQNGLAKVVQLRAAEFTWKSDETAKPQVGLIAQDVLAVLPQAVNVPEEGATEKDGSPAMMGVQYTDVIPLLVASIKELKSELDSVKAELAALKGA